LRLFPLDNYVEAPVAVMDRVMEDKARDLKVPVWDEYQKIVNKAENTEVKFEKVERFAFYERAKRAFAVVHTGEKAQYGNIIIKKGLVLDQ